MRFGEWCDTVNGEQGVAEDQQEHMPTGVAGRETSHDGGPFYEKSKRAFYCGAVRGATTCRKIFEKKQPES